MSGDHVRVELVHTDVERGFIDICQSKGAAVSTTNPDRNPLAYKDEELFNEARPMRVHRASHGRGPATTVVAPKLYIPASPPPTSTSHECSSSVYDRFSGRWLNRLCPNKARRRH
jgi:hypothetical protein